MSIHLDWAVFGSWYKVQKIIELIYPYNPPLTMDSVPSVHTPVAIKDDLAYTLKEKRQYMYKYVIAESPNGYEIYVNLIASSAGQYLSRQPYVLNLIKEVLGSVKLTTPQVAIEHDMGRIIGNTDIVETSEKDTIFYAQPSKRKVFSRFAKNRFPSPSQHLTIILGQDADGNYEIYDTWIGPCSPPFPGDEKANDKSKLYWQNHALVMDAQAVQSKTITKVCPY